mmetsp:Transcript_10774/g.23777  ORF Transcript_10774/g.23777 Transcript_10774/m.23777 type:complete len:325 (-) Transcript_10774:344-1318(-)
MLGPEKAAALRRCSCFFVFAHSPPIHPVHPNVHPLPLPVFVHRTHYTAPLWPEIMSANNASWLHFRHIQSQIGVDAMVQMAPVHEYQIHHLIWDMLRSLLRGHSQQSRAIFAVPVVDILRIGISHIRVQCFGKIPRKGAVFPNVGINTDKLNCGELRENHLREMARKNPDFNHSNGSVLPPFLNHAANQHRDYFPTHAMSLWATQNVVGPFFSEWMRGVAVMGAPIFLMDLPPFTVHHLAHVQSLNQPQKMIRPPHIPPHRLGQLLGGVDDNSPHGLKPSAFQHPIRQLHLNLLNLLPQILERCTPLGMTELEHKSLDHGVTGC